MSLLLRVSMHVQSLEPKYVPVMVGLLRCIQELCDAALELRAILQEHPTGSLNYDWYSGPRTSTLRPVKAYGHRVPMTLMQARVG